MSLLMRFGYWWEQEKSFFFLWWVIALIWSHFDDSMDEAYVILFFVWAIPTFIVSFFIKPKLETLARLEDLWAMYPNGTLWHHGYSFSSLYFLSHRTIQLPKYVKTERHSDYVITLMLTDKSYMFFYRGVDDIG